MKNIFNFRSLRSKMITGFFSVLLLAVFVMIYNLFVMDNVNKTTSNILYEELPLLIVDEQLEADVTGMVAASRGFVLAIGADE